MDNQKELREMICEIGRRMFLGGMATSNDGNISVRLGTGDILCTPTGISKGYMKPECICRINREGKLLQAGGNYRPSSEIRMHLRVYEKRPDVGAVVHAHPPYATSFEIAGIPLARPIMAEAVVQLGYVPVAPYGTPSTEEVPDSIEPFLKDFNACLLQNHGALAWAGSLEAAYMKLESVEFYARQLFQTRLLGSAKLLDEEKLETLYELRRRMGLGERPPRTFLEKGTAGEELINGD